MPPNRAVTLDSLTALVNQTLGDSGLFVRGVFNPAPGDAVPTLPDGQPTKTLLLIGNAGPALWQAFVRACPGFTGRDPLDRWVDAHLVRAVDAVRPVLSEWALSEGALSESADPAVDILYPTRIPWPPIQQWAMRCEPVSPSPLGLMIHPHYGLWHAWRGAICLAARLPVGSTAVPQQSARQSPCDSCDRRPCLSSCPVAAFQPDGFDAVRCVDHVKGPDRGHCKDLGCQARRACPLGAAFRYPADAAAFHMQAVLNTVI